jgi:hypothetical protein
MDDGFIITDGVEGVWMMGSSIQTGLRVSG